MVVGLATALIIATLGISVGAVAGLYGGLVDPALMRLVDIVYAVPSLLLAMLLMTSLGRGVWQLCLSIGVVSWPTMARLVRGQFLSLREQEFVKAARVAGTGDFKMIVRHLLPNALTPVVVALTFAIPGAIFAEAALSFLGIGINPPTPNWGQMVAQSQAYFGSDPWLVLPPVLGVAFALLSFTFLGDGLRDVLDPFMNE